MSDELTLDAAVVRIGELVRDVDKLNTNWKNELSRRVDAETERDALALELQSVKDALAQVVAENTANVAAAERSAYKLGLSEQLEVIAAKLCENCADAEQGIISGPAAWDGKMWRHTRTVRATGEEYPAERCSANGVRKSALYPEPANG